MRHFASNLNVDDSAPRDLMLRLQSRSSFSGGKKSMNSLSKGLNKPFLRILEVFFLEQRSDFVDYVTANVEFHREVGVLVRFIYAGSHNKIDDIAVQQNRYKIGGGVGPCRLRLLPALQHL